MNEVEKLQHIFNEVQGCDISEFNRWVSSAYELSRDQHSFIPIIHVLLQCNKNSFPGRISRLLRSLFEKLHEKEPEYLNGCVFKYIFQFTSSKSIKARKHSLRLLYTILQITAYELDLSLLQSIGERLFDKEVSVRREALKIGLMYQNRYLAEDLKLQSTLKDLIRYDTAPDIRRAVLAGLEISPSTLNCVLERVIDSSLSVRKTFWSVCLPKMTLEDIKHDKRLFLLHTAYTEREFEAQKHLISFLLSFPIETVANAFYSGTLPEYNALLESFLLSTPYEPTLDNASIGSIRLLYTHYRITEKRSGRDSLNLYPIDQVLDLAIQECLKADESSIEIACEIFSLLSFYDVFAGESRKIVLKVLKRLLTSQIPERVVDEGVRLLKKVASADEVINFIGSIIKKIVEMDLKSQTHHICAAVLKNLEFSDLHEAIFREIALPNPEAALRSIFWYIWHKPTPENLLILLEYLSHECVLQGIIDLIIAGFANIALIYEHIRNGIVDSPRCFSIPVSKLLLASKIPEADVSFFLEHLLVFYYSHNSHEIQQFLILFFCEYSAYNYKVMNALFCRAMEKIKANHRVFVDQMIYWIQRGGEPALQDLFYTICLFIQANYDNLKSKPYLFLALNFIEPTDAWERDTVKRTVSLLSMIIKRRPKENAQLILGKVVAVDDGLPISEENYKKLLDDIACYVKQE